MAKKIVCPECGKPLKCEVLETWGAGHETMSVSCCGTCSQCDEEFAWEMTYKLDEVGEVEPV